MLERANDYRRLYGDFRWPLPSRYNIGIDVADRQSPGALALIHDHGDGVVRRYTFGDITRWSNRLANALRALGVERGDRIGLLLPQSPETAVAHVATYKLGAIAVPLFTLFGPDALEFRLGDSGAKVLITTPDQFDKVAALTNRLPDLRHVIVTGAAAPAGALAFDALTEAASDAFTPADTAADDPALIIYTSGTTGNPKGALHAHRVLLGHLPGVELPQDFFPQPGDLFWTPADWAWIGGLLDVLLPAWHHGVPVLAHRARKFDPEQALQLMAAHNVRNVFLPPTALKLMRQVPEATAMRYGAAPRSIGSGGERLGEELQEWGRRVFGITINEFYGQTECNLVISNCASLMPPRPGSMGRAVPGHVVEIVDDAGQVVAPGQSGNIAVRRPDPVMFLNYWNQPEATRQKFAGDWLLTGDMGTRDDDGYFWFSGRTDDVITSAGYRIGPAEIEDCLIRHPAVTMAAVVGSPDPVRTELIKAFVVLRPGTPADAALCRELQEFVKTRLAAHEYPREIEFVPDLPTTATGKILRRELKRREVERKRGDAG